MSIETETIVTGAKPTPTPRTVKITHADAHDGRLPVTVSVVPRADLDAKGGVFVEFRTGPKVVEPLDALPRMQGEGPATTQQGDDAIALLAANESAAAPHKHPATPIVSHQIAQATKLSVGQAETFRADVALPPPSETEAWFMRARFATLGGNDLSSGWRRV